MKFIRTNKIVHAGQPGSKKYLNIYGDDLVCIRYKYDYKRNRKIKTIELKVEETAWTPRPNDTFAMKPVLLKVLYQEQELRKLVKNANAIWHSNLKLWELPLFKAVELGLENRIVE